MANGNGTAWKIASVALTIILLLTGWIYKAMAEQIHENTLSVRANEKMIAEINTHLRYIIRLLESHTEDERESSH